MFEQRFPTQQEIIENIYYQSSMPVRKGEKPLIVKTLTINGVKVTEKVVSFKSILSTVMTESPRDQQVMRLSMIEVKDDK